MKVSYRARALADIDDISAYLGQRSPAGARNVLQSIHDSIRIIAEQSQSPERTDLPEYSREARSPLPLSNILQHR